MIICSLKNTVRKMYCILSSIVVVFSVGCSGTSPGDAATRITELDTELPAVVAGGNSPSIQVAVVDRNQIIWSRAFGENTSVDHVYMNASVQKMFTAVAILQLVERGLIDLDADVSTYVPFPVRHPDFPETAITVQMLLAHRSGLDSFDHQFDWDTESSFAPKYRASCPPDLAAMSLEEFLVASLTPEGSNYTRRAWVLKPGQKYHYSVSAFPLLRYVVSRVSGQRYADYMHTNVFGPLGMTGSGFSAEEFSGRHAVPYTRIKAQNVELPLWDGQGSMMHTTAEDMARFVLALMNGGQYGDFQLLQPETIELMQQRTSSFRFFFRYSDDMPRGGHGLGLFDLKGGWFGYGGSAPGFQCLLRFHPSRHVGYVILSNVNAILSGGDNYESARGEIYRVQDALVSILDPTLVIRRRAPDVAIVVGAFVLGFLAVKRWFRKRKS